MSVISALDIDKLEIKEETYYIGTVVDNEDPFKIGRVRVRIPEIFGDSNQISDNDIPWAALMMGVGSGGKGISTFQPVSLGSKVLVKFLRGSLYSPLCIGRISDTEGASIEQYTSYLDKYILYMDKDGNQIMINTSSDKFDFIFNGDATLDIQGSGKLTINCLTAEVNSAVSAKIKSPAIDLEGNTTVTGSLNVSGSTTITNSLSTTGSATIGGGVAATGAVSGATVSDALGNLASRRALVTSGSSAGSWSLIP